MAEAQSTERTAAVSPLLEAAWRSPIPALAAGLIAGQVAAGMHAPFPIAWRVACAAVALAALLRPAWRRAGLVALAALGGFVQVEAAVRIPVDPAHAAALGGQRVVVRARIAADPERLPEKMRVVLEVEAVRRGGAWRAGRGRVLLSIAHARQQWAYGARVEGVLALKRPRNFGNPGEFDYEGYLARRGIFATAFLFRDDAVVLRPPAGSPGGIRWARRRIAAAFDRELRSPVREILGALILGESAGVPPEVRARFARTGVSHVLAVSGLHVGMVGGAAFCAFWWLLGRSRWILLRTRMPKVAAVLSFGPVALYAALAQGRFATLRATLMLTVVVAAVLCDRRRAVLVSVAVAALVISLGWPGAALDVSFQLSFAAVIAIVVGMPPYWRWWRRYEAARLLSLRGGAGRWAGAGLAYAMVGVCALIGTAPLAAFHFNLLSPVAVAANLVVVPVLGTAAVGLGLCAALAVLLWEPAAGVPIALAGAVVWLGDRCVALIAALPGAALRVPTPSVTELALAYAAIAVAACTGPRVRWTALSLVLALAALDVAREVPRRYFRTALRVTFLSVGQGDSALVEFPGAEVMLVDGGGLTGFDVGERVVAPFLWRRKIGRVDYLVLTHPQRDHFGGLTFLAREFRPREFWHNGDDAGTSDYAGLRAALAASGTRAVIARQGDVRTIGGCEVRVLWPPERGEARNPNDRSVVMRVQCGDVSVLLPGDVQSPGEAGLVASGAPLRSTVVKVSHHGSRSSSTPPFVGAVAPAVAVVSSGFANRFGFPDPTVVAAWRQCGAVVYRTDRDGAVTVAATGGGGVQVWAVRRPEPALVAPRRRRRRVTNRLTHRDDGFIVTE